MAIDDNTSYELTGAQVKDLANKIKAKAADNIFVGATSALPGSKGLVPAPQAADDTKFLSGDGTWKTVSTGPSYSAGTGIDITSNTISIDTSVVAELSDLPSVMTGASSGTAGASGLVPAPAAGDDTKFLSGDGLWKTISIYSLPIASSSTLGGIKVGNNLSIDSGTGVLSATDTTYSAGTNVQISAQNVISATDTTYSAFTGATTQVAGASGLVPAPTTSDPDKFLKGDGTWGTPAGKTYTAGDHVNISNQDVISAYGYIWGDTPTPATTPTGTITSGMIADGTITAADIATGVVPTITLSTTDIGEGAPLAANTLYGVYE